MQDSSPKPPLCEAALDPRSIEGFFMDRRVAYVADPCAVRGPAALFEQKRAIDRYAIREKISFDHYVVDSGASPGAEGIAFGLHALLHSVRLGDVGTVLVEHISRFSVDYAVALRIAAAMSSWGADVHEARGGCVRIDRSLAARVAGRVGCRGPRTFGGARRTSRSIARPGMFERVR